MFLTSSSTKPITAQHQIIRNLTEQSAGWEEKATHRTEIIRELGIKLDRNPDVDEEEEEQL